MALVDTTLREGSQAPVPYLSPAQRLRVVEHVAAIGIEEIELGHAVARAAYAADADALASLVEGAASVAPGVRRTVWCRALAEDIEAAALVGAEAVSFAVPVSDAHLTRRLGRDRAWALDQVARLTGTARDLGVGFVSIGLEDATRADQRFVAGAAAVAHLAGADRVRIADTVGIAAPAHVVGLVQTVRGAFGGEVGVHVHNDFGMATAVAVAALEAGATCADVSLLGLGERAGISRAEEVTAWLTACRDGAYDAVAARAAAREVAAWVGRPVGAAAPIIGDDVFACESGLHLAGLLRDPALYEPCDPGLVGGERRWRLGSGAGASAVAALLPEHAGDATGAAVRCRDAAARRGRALEPWEWDEAARA